jgi:serine/threonine-protein kinase
MTALTSSLPGPERNLLLGMLALRNDFISPDALVAALNAWAQSKATPLADILIEQGRLRRDDCALLESLVRRHLELHADDPRRSLSALPCPDSTRQMLEQIADVDVQASMAHLTPNRPTMADTGPASLPPRSDSGPRYRILRPHARGGLGEVFVALDEELHREVALKEMQDRYAADPASRARFLLEAEVTGRLEHPGVVPVYGLGISADGRPYYAMRFIRGDSLQQAIQAFHQREASARDPGERTLALRALLGRFVAVCNAVAYAHSRGVLHRDLKPGNIMLGPYGETLVVDWGLAKPGGLADQDGPNREESLQPSAGGSSEPTQAGAALGTPGYMSPEQAAGNLKEMGPASDVYSLGSTLYHLLTGKAPFAGKDVLEVLSRVEAGDFLPPRQVHAPVPPALEAVCLKAMALRPSDRYASPRALAEDIEHWLADEPVSPYSEPLAVRLGRWGRRHRAVVSGAAALLLTALAALAAGLVAVDHERQRTATANAELARLNTDLEAEQQRTQDALQAEARRRRQARQALDALASRLVEDWLSRQQVLQPEHKRFLAQALASYEEFAKDTGDDEEARLGVARAYHRIGHLRGLLGQAAEAEAAYDRSRELYAKLAADFPDRSELRRQLATNLHNRGGLYATTGRSKEAEAAFRDALAIRIALASEFPDRAEIRREMARSQINLGIFLRSAGRLPEAEEAVQAAVTVQRQLVADFRDHPEFRQELGQGASLRGVLLMETARLKEAEAAYGEAIAILEQLAADFPNQPEFRQDLANSLNNRGGLYASTDRLKEAETAYRAALTVHQQLVADFPARPEFRQDLGSSHNNLGLLLVELGRPREAEAAYRDAVSIQKRLAADFPARPEFRHELALSTNSLALLLKTANRPKEAEAAFRDALALERPLAPGAAAPPHYQDGLGTTLTNLANLLRDQGQARPALSLLEEALPLLHSALKANPRHPEYQTHLRQCHKALAETQLRLADHAAAAAAVDQLAQAPGASAEDLYTAAGLLATTIPLARQDTRLSEAQRPEVARGYAARALALLRQAVAHGYKDLANMKKDKALDPLRDDPAFRKLLAEMAKPAQ